MRRAPLTRRRHCTRARRVRWTAAELQTELASSGDPLAARDAFVAGAAKELNEPLAVSDPDFDVEGLSEELTVDFV